MMKKLLISIVSLLAILMLSAAALAAGQTTTVMMYMCGTNLQDDCIYDIYEMCNARLGSNINVVVLAGGANKWDDRQLTPKHLNLFTIQNGKFGTVTDWGKGNMGDPDTLTKFISYCWSNYPASRNVLVMWDHGGGSSKGVCFDEVYYDDGLTLAELDSAFLATQRKHSDFHLDIVGMDACLMAGYEVAVLSAPYADYLVASEELVPGIGWHYTSWLNALSDDPGMSTLALCTAIVDGYANALRRAGDTEYTTMSVIDLSKIPALEQDIELLSVYLGRALSNGQLATVTRMVSRMYAFGSYESVDSDSDMYDMGSFLDMCEQFAPDTAASARTHLSDAVVYSYASNDMPVASGMSIYIPHNSKRSFSRRLSGYQMTGSIPYYVDFVSGMVSMMNGNSYTFTASNAPVSQNAGATAITAYQFDGLIPASTFNAETGQVTSFIAGLNGQGTNEPSYGSGGLSALIAGLSGQPAPTAQPVNSGLANLAALFGVQPTAAPQTGTLNLDGIIAGLGVQTTPVPSAGGSDLSAIIAGLGGQPTAAPTAASAIDLYGLAGLLDVSTTPVPVQETGDDLYANLMALLGPTATATPAPVDDFGFDLTSIIAGVNSSTIEPVPYTGSADLGSVIAGVQSPSGEIETNDGMSSIIAGLNTDNTSSLNTELTAPYSSYIAGTAGNTVSSTAGSGTVPGFIAGSLNLNAYPEFANMADITSADVASVPGFIAGSATQAAAPSQSLGSNDVAFSLTLSSNDILNLDYAEGALFIDQSDESSISLIDLGYMRNSWIDWSNHMVYSAFDQTWPTLAGQPVVLYDRSVTEIARRSLVPVKVNGQETYLVVMFAGNNSHTGTILGYNDGVNHNGLLIKDTMPLVPGDVITPIYTQLYCTAEELDDLDAPMHERTLDGAAIVWDGNMTITYEPLNVGMDYQFAFYMNDIYGEVDISDFIPFSM